MKSVNARFAQTSPLNHVSINCLSQTLLQDQIVHHIIVTYSHNQGK